MTIEGWEKLLTFVNLRFLFFGLEVTLKLAIIVSILSFLIALPLGIHRASTRGAMRLPSTIFVDIVRNTPVLVMLFLVRFGTPEFGLRVTSFTSAVIAMTIYNSAMLAEIVRAGIESIPHGQFEAADASGLAFHQKYALVILPQALRNMLPALVGQFIILLQGTTLASAVSVLELTGAGQVLFTRLGNPLETFTLLAVIYFALDYALSVFRTQLEHRTRATLAVALD